MSAAQPGNFYRFVEEIYIPFPPEAVWDVLADPRLLPQWWKGVYLNVEPLEPFEGPRTGKRYRVRARGFLPYRLNFTLEPTELERPSVIAVRTQGDLTGTWRCELHAVSLGTRAVMTEEVLAEKPLLKLFTPVLKPLFTANHRWTTPRAESGLTEYLQQQSHRR